MSAGDGGSGPTHTRADGTERLGYGPGRHPMRAELIEAGILRPAVDETPHHVDHEALGWKVLTLDAEGRRKAGARAVTPRTEGGRPRAQ